MNALVFFVTQHQTFSQLADWKSSQILAEKPTLHSDKNFLQGVTSTFSLASIAISFKKVTSS